jgi:hypothetical protein
VPSKKQRRRRQKERRHEYEYVYVDDEGREVDPAEVEIEREPKERTKQATAKSAAKPGANRATGKVSRASVREVPPPSWRRVLKRSAIFAPFMLIAISLLGQRLSWSARVLETIWLLLLFVPFSYVIDRMMYRRYLRQSGQPPPAGRQRRA